MSGQPPRWLLVRLDPAGSPAARRAMLAWLAAVMPHLDWHSHVVLAGGDREQLLAAAEVAAAHVERHQFVTVRLQPCLDVDAEVERELLALAGRFQERAYREQTEPGLELLPVLTSTPDTVPAALIAAVTRLRARVAEPRLVLAIGNAAALEAALTGARLGELRRDVLDSARADAGTVLELLGSGLVVESVVERLAGDPAEALVPCRPHLVADQTRGLLFPCVRAFASGGPAVPLETFTAGEPPELAPPAELCPSCYAAAVQTAAPGLARSGRPDEATAAALRIAVALAGRDEHVAAARVAACAAGLAARSEERAGALLLEGLCRQRGGDLEGAVERLRDGLAVGVAAAERPRVLLSLAACLEQLGRPDEAAVAATEAARMTASAPA